MILNRSAHGPRYISPARFYKIRHGLAREIFKIFRPEKQKLNFLQSDIRKFKENRSVFTKL